MDTRTYGHRLMPQLVDEISQTRDRVYATIAYSDGKFRDVKFSDIACAVNWMAHHLKTQFGSSESHETLAYIGANDLRYTVIFLAGAKCGYKVLLPSPRNTVSINHLLLSITKCSKVIYASELSIKVKEINALQSDLKTLAIPSLPDLLGTTSEPFPFTGTFDERKWEPVLILHSSGSTGTPKPITMYHATFAVIDHDRLVPSLPGRKNQNHIMYDLAEGEKFYSPFPGFHLAGFTAMVAIPIYAEYVSLVMGSADRPPAPEIVMEIMKQVPIRALFCPPAIAEGLASDPDGVQLASKLKFLLYAGGPLSELAGSALSKVTDVCQFYGQTETGPIQSILPQRENWAWLEWHPVQEVRMEPYDDELFELVMDRNPKLEKIRALSCNFPDNDVWHTKDLFRKHPTREMWQFAGRTDDIIVLSSGEKYNPVPAEVEISSHPDIRGAMIVGQGQFSPLLLLELASERTIADLWPFIDTVNKRSAEYGRISRSLIVVASTEKSFERAAKGTIIRSATARKFKEEIENKYASQSIETTDAPILDGPMSEFAIAKLVDQIILQVARDASIAKDTDIFASGVDSLQVLEVVKLLKHGLASKDKQKDLKWINPGLVYMNPTRSTLRNAIWYHLSRRRHSGVSMDTLSEMRSMINREAQLIANPPRPISVLKPRAVVLTGCTGSLGAHILNTLILDSSIISICCLVRDANATQRLPRGLRSRPGFEKVTFLVADLGDTKLGLAAEHYDRLQQDTNCVVHAAWAVNYNHKLQSFDRHFIAGLKYLYNLLLGKTNAHLLFISSLSTVSNWKTTGNTSAVPESFIPDPAVTAPMGYAQSKYVAESICQKASNTLGVKTSVLRVGQIAAPTQDSLLSTKWNGNEWIPIMLQSSKALGKMPYDLPDVDWLPVDVVAGIVRDVLIAGPAGSNCEFYNVVNPASTAFGDHIPSIMKELGVELESIDLASWIALVRGSEQSSSMDIKTIPAAKILDFFEALLTRSELCYQTEKLREHSSTFQRVKSIDGAQMSTWVNCMDLSQSS